MQNKIHKTPEEVNKQIESWYFKYHGLTIDDITGREPFALWRRACGIIYDEEDDYCMPDLLLLEIPSLILRVREKEYITVSTHRFIRQTAGTETSILFSDFDHHRGFKDIQIVTENNIRIANVKRDGYIADFEIRLKDGTSVTWPIPTGDAGFAFWNITKKCELIGRKYEIGESPWPYSIVGITPNFHLCYFDYVSLSWKSQGMTYKQAVLKLMDMKKLSLQEVRQIFRESVVWKSDAEQAEMLPDSFFDEHAME